jgi:predicted NUDIX family NTP pyrophosphohydrolase
MGEQSAGILAYRRTSSGIEVLLVHPGGPFWAGKDAGAWSIPKGLFQAGEDPLEAARREFAEETGSVPQGDLVPLGSARQPSGKTIHAWAVEADVDVSQLTSNTFAMEWPPKSGERREFPEVDKGGWFSLAVAKEKILKGQRAFLERLSAGLEAPRDVQLK